MCTQCSSRSKAVYLGIHRMAMVESVAFQSDGHSTSSICNVAPGDKEGGQGTDDSGGKRHLPQGLQNLLPQRAHGRVLGILGQAIFLRRGGQHIDPPQAAELRLTIDVRLGEA